MSRKNTTRRSVLRYGAALSSFAAIGSLAGCSESGGNTTTAGGNGGGNGNGNGNGGMTTTVMGGNGGMTTQQQQTTTTTTTQQQQTTTTTQQQQQTTTTTQQQQQTTTQGGGQLVGGPGGTADIGDIPAAAEAVITLDMDGMIQDSTLQSIADTFLQELAKSGNYQGPTSVQQALGAAQQGAGLKATSIGDLAMYMKVTGQTAATVQQYFGMIMYTGYPNQQLINTIQSQTGTGSQLTQETYGGQTIYVANTGMAAQETVFAPLGGGKFVVGTRAAAEDAIDVSTGSAGALSGALRNHYQSTTSGGYLRFASIVPQSQLPGGGQTPTPGGGMQIDGLNDLQAVSGSFYTSGSKVGMAINMHTGGSGSASDLAKSVNSLIQVAGMQYNNQDIQEVIAAISVTSSGSTASITYEQPASKIKSYIKKYASSLVMGVGGGMGSSP